MDGRTGKTCYAADLLGRITAKLIGTKVLCQQRKAPAKYRNNITEYTSQYESSYVSRVSAAGR